MVTYAIKFPEISPDFFSISLGGFDLSLKWYSLSYILGILIALFLMKRLLSHNKIWPENNPAMTKSQADDLITLIVVGIIIGGRLGFVSFYQPDYYLSNPLEIFMVWKGGMSFHGGFIGVTLATLWFCKRNLLPFYGVTDLLAVVTPPGLFLGRVANFINNELWGRPTEWYFGVIFPGPSAQDCPGFSTPCARHPSQLYEAGLEGLLLGAIMLWLSINRMWFKKVGNLTGFFLLFYGISRFGLEILRQPDAYLISNENPMGYLYSTEYFNITMGQALSLPMVAFGLLLLMRRTQYD